MAILNKTNYPYIYPNSIDMRSDTMIHQIRNWNDANYWYCEFLLGIGFDTFKIDSLVPADVLDKIKTDDSTFLVLCNCHEAFHSIVEPIYKFVIEYADIPPEKIIVITESADLHTVVLDYTAKNNVKPFNVEWVRMFQSGVRGQKYHQSRTPGYVEPKTLALKPYPKRYLNFNRRWRLHRPTLVSLLIAKNLLDKGYISLGRSDCGTRWTSVFGWIEGRLGQDPELKSLLESNKERIINTPDLYLDNNDLMTNKADLTVDTDSLYAETLVSICSETNFFPEFETGRFLSEKTWKPMAYRHPFIVVTVPRTLELLRSMGYKTFHPIIDETYDTEEDPVRRLKLIVNEIERISNLSDEEVNHFISNIASITEHNYNRLMNDTTFITKTL